MPLDSNIEVNAGLLNQALINLRVERNDPESKLGKRELSEAITCIETGCMWMNRAMFTQEKPDYKPTDVFKNYK